MLTRASRAVWRSIGISTLENHLRSGPLLLETIPVFQVASLVGLMPPKEDVGKRPILASNTASGGIGDFLADPSAQVASAPSPTEAASPRRDTSEGATAVVRTANPNPRKDAPLFCRLLAPRQAPAAQLYWTARIASNHPAVLWPWGFATASSPENPHSETAAKPPAARARFALRGLSLLKVALRPGGGCWGPPSELVLRTGLIGTKPNQSTGPQSVDRPVPITTIRAL
jgi:hypothetical protein